MNKLFYYLVLPILLMGAVACSDSKEDFPPPPTPAEQELENIAKKLDQMSDVANFTKVFKETEIDVSSEKLTILATSEKPAQRSLRANAETIGKENIKRHIIEGIHNFFAMEKDSLTLKSIDGTDLYITKYKDVVYVNGIALTRTKDEVSKSIIYIIENVIPVESKPLGKYTLNVDVKMCQFGGESAANPYTAAGDTLIYFYTKTGNTFNPADSVLTNKEGKGVLYHNIEGELYYNIEANTLSTSYVLLGVFKNETEVKNWAQYMGNDMYKEAYVGGPKYQDTNGDGIVNEADKEAYPRKVEGKTLEIFLAPFYNELTPEQISLDEYMEALDKTFAEVVKRYYNLDSRLKNSTRDFPLLQMIESTNQSFFEKSYQYVHLFNKVETGELRLSVGQKAIWEKAKDKYMAQYIYVYASLVNVYGTPPLVTHVITNIGDIPGNTPTNEIMAHLVGKQKNMQENYAYAAELVLARTYLNLKDYANAKLMAKETIESGMYALAADTSMTHATASNKEVLLGGIASEGVNNAPGKFIHPLRITEAYLIAAEASAKLGNNAEALQYLNILQARVNQPSVNDVSALNAIYAREMKNEGQWHMTNGRRWEILPQIVPTAQSYNNLLPFPRNEIERNKNMRQNPGYM